MRKQVRGLLLVALVSTLHACRIAPEPVTQAEPSSAVSVAPDSAVASSTATPGAGRAESKPPVSGGGAPDGSPSQPTASTAVSAQWLRFPPLAIAPTYRWNRPAAGFSWEVLPAEPLILYPTPSSHSTDSVPFTLVAVRPGGSKAWSVTLDSPASAIRAVDSSADGERILIAGDSGEVMVLAAADGQSMGSAYVDFDRGGEESTVTFTDLGHHLAVWRHTPSGAFPAVLSVYGLDGGSAVRYGTKGLQVYASPFNDMILGLSANGVEVVRSTGEVGVIPIAGEPWSGAWSIGASADGTQIYVRSPDQGLLTYGPDLKLQWRMAMGREDRLFTAPVAKLHWIAHPDGTVELVGARGSVLFRTQLSKGSMVPLQALPGGELRIRVSTDGRSSECFITTAGEVIGCVPGVGAKRNRYGTAAAESWFWTVDDVSVSVYRFMP